MQRMIFLGLGKVSAMGRWITIDSDTTQTDIDTTSLEILKEYMRRYKGIATLDDIEVTDSEGFYHIAGKDVERLIKLARALDEFEDEEMAEAFAMYLHNHGVYEDPDIFGQLADFQNHFSGIYDDKEEYAADYLEQMGVEEALTPFGLHVYIGILADAVARDLELGGDMDFYQLSTGRVAALSTH